MRTTLNIDDQLLSDFIILSGKKNRSEAVRFALKEYVKQYQKKLILSLRGNVDIDDNWKELRSLEIDE